MDFTYKKAGGGLGKRIAVGFTSIALAASLTALAPGFTQQAHADSYASDTDKYVSCASNRAAEPAPEILGINNVSSNTVWSKLGALNWSAPYYYIFGTSEYNTNPDPLMVNSVQNAKAGFVKYTPCMVIGNGETRGKGGPSASLNNYSLAKVVWDQMPNVVLGNDMNYVYNSRTFARSVGVEGYKTYGAGDDYGSGDYGVKYDYTNIYTMIDSMYNLATAANNAAAGENKQTRYGNPTTIVANFERYVKGTQGYVLKQLNKDGKSKKSVCLIYDYDKAHDKYKILVTGKSEGTATANRYLEAVQNVATNIADDGLPISTEGSGDDEITYATATRELVEDCDLIMVGSQSGMENITSTEGILSSLSTTAQDKAYWASSENGSAGSCYGVVMNSVENAQNIGRILGCLYPEYIDQSDWIAYYYQNFYHLKSDKLAKAIDNAMDGVRNYNAKGSSQTATTWEKSDVNGYKQKDVANKLAEGMSYLVSLSDEAPTLLKPTSNYTDAASGIEDGDTEINLSTVDVPSAVSGLKYNGKSQTGVNAGTGYAVTSGSATNAGTHKATVEPEDGYTWSDGTAAAKTVEFSIAKASQSLKVTAKTKTVKKAKVKKKAQKVTGVFTVKGAQGKVTYAKKSGSAKLKVASNGKITVKKKTKKGTYKVKVVVKAAGNGNYNAATKTVTVKVKVK